MPSNAEAATPAENEEEEEEAVEEQEEEEEGDCREFVAF